MDGRQFDTLVKTLRSRIDRRGILGAVLGGTLMPLLGEPQRAMTKRRERRRRKRATARRRTRDAAAERPSLHEECDVFCQDIPQQQSAQAKCKRACRSRLYEECAGNPARLCMGAHGGGHFSFTCCGPCERCARPEGFCQRRCGACDTCVGEFPNDRCVDACDGKSCGEAVDACGQTVSCGSCSGSQTCENGQCVTSGCIPDNIAACAGKNCGQVVNNCGETISCGGGCPPNQTCGGGGTPNVCGCTPDNAAACAGRSCGQATNNCGHVISCGVCAAPSICQGGQCVPSPCTANCPETHFCCSTIFAPAGICCMIGEACRVDMGCLPI